MEITKRGTFGWPVTAAKTSDTDLGLVIHYDGGAGVANTAGHSSCVSYWKNTRKFHMNTRKWSDIGYSYGVCPHGYVFEGRGYGRQQAAQLSDAGKRPFGNSRYASCTLMLAAGQKPTSKAVNAVQWLVATLVKRGMNRRVFAHQDFSDTSCPGAELLKLVKSGAFLPSRAEAMPTLRLTSPYTYGDAVRVVQRFVKVEDDGWYGPVSVKAVNVLKKAHGWTQDGVVNVAVWRVILGE